MKTVIGWLFVWTLVIWRLLGGAAIFASSGGGCGRQVGDVAALKIRMGETALTATMVTLESLQGGTMGGVAVEGVAVAGS
jgi:hypothetical protein